MFLRFLTGFWVYCSRFFRLAGDLLFVCFKTLTIIKLFRNSRISKTIRLRMNLEFEERFANRMKIRRGKCKIFSFNFIHFSFPISFHSTNPYSNSIFKYSISVLGQEHGERIRYRWYLPFIYRLVFLLNDWGWMRSTLEEALCPLFQFCVLLCWFTITF